MPVLKRQKPQKPPTLGTLKKSVVQVRNLSRPGVGIHFRVFETGIQMFGNSVNTLTLERYVPHSPRERAKDRKNRRRKWYIVDRTNHKLFWCVGPKFPGIVAGPFPNFRIAFLAYEMLV